MASAASFYQPRLPIKKIDLKSDLIDDRWSVKVPHHVAYVVLVSLIRNSRDAIGPDGGRIYVHGEETGADTVLLHIDDTGCGIPKEDEEKIFIPGFSRKGGSGRGLPLARTVLRRHNGDLFISKAPAGVSTRFTIAFPREQV